MQSEQKGFARPQLNFGGLRNGWVTLPDTTIVTLCCTGMLYPSCRVVVISYRRVLLNHTTLINFVYNGFHAYIWIVSVCRFTCHEKCMNNLIVSCPYLALTGITVRTLAVTTAGIVWCCCHLCVQKPLAHKWGKAVTTSRRFCNICRRKADPSMLMSCQGEHLLNIKVLYTCPYTHTHAHLCICIFVVCNYYTHKNCKMFAMVNCKATSLYIDAVQVQVCFYAPWIVTTCISDFFITTRAPLDWRKSAKRKMWGVHEVNLKWPMSSWTKMHLVWNNGTAA